jgi:ubiquitin carboxyl-terminal hydrolase 4/11/15
VEINVSLPDESPIWELATVVYIDSQRDTMKVKYDHGTLQESKIVRLESEEVCKCYTHVAKSKAKATSTGTNFLSSTYNSLSSVGNWYSGGSSRNANDRGQPVRPGVVGLRNLGNTCFMNSMLQCLSHAHSLTEVFTTDAHLKEINKTNVLGTASDDLEFHVAPHLNQFFRCSILVGMGGRVAMEYGSLVKDLWSGDYTVVTPSSFKSTIGEFQPQFSGYQQQDSQVC